MDRFYNALRQLRPWSQPAIYVGVAMIAAIWVSINFHLTVEHDRSRRIAIQETGNLARVFEEHIVRTIMEADRAILLLRTSYQLTGNFDLANSLASPSLRNDLLTQIRVFDPDGAIIAATRERSLSRVGFSDREYFRVHVDSKADELFVSKPVFGRTSGKWVLQLTRGVRAADGSFQGVIGASLDPDYLARFYQSIDVGQDGAIVLAGLDGVVRASAGFKNEVIGGSLLGSQLFKKISQADTGSFLTAGNQDGIKRIVSYRVVKGFPLVVYAGESEDEVLTNYWRARRLCFAAGTGLTLLIAIGAAFAALYRSRLDAVQRELEATLENMSQGIMKVDADHNVAFINRRAIELLELPDRFLKRHVALADVLKFQWTRGEFGTNGEALDPRVREKIQSRDLHHIGVYQRTRPNGVVLEIATVASPDGGVIRTYTDVTERRRNEIRIAHLLRHDDLTALANRTLFKERIEQALMRVRRENEGFALFCLDLDGFKAVNDTRGHPAGDMLLRAVADRLSGCVRETDTVARLGGDEFVVLCEDVAGGISEVEVLAQRLAATIAGPLHVADRELFISASIGIALAGATDDAEELVKQADRAMYLAKQRGRACYEIYRTTIDEGLERRAELLNSLHRACEGAELQLHYQPIKVLHSNDITAMEALLRWDHPTLGPIPPSEFIPLAEDTGLIRDIGRWVLTQACSDCADWRRRGASDVGVTINISGRQLEDPHIADIVRDALERAQLPAEAVTLELTESILFSDAPHILDTLTDLHGIGLRLAIDDFGTGYSSLSYLSKFPIDLIKIDRSFVAGLDQTGRNTTIVFATIELAHALGLTVVAEGVETEAELAELRNARCDAAQGFLLGRPASLVDNTRHLKERR